MVYVARQTAETSGVYRQLLEFFEADLAEWAANTSQSHEDGAPFPRQRILDDLRARRVVNVPTYALPGSVLDSAPWRPGPVDAYGPRRGRPTRIHPQRAVVYPDDGITFSDEDWGRLWLEESGIVDL